MPEVHPVVFLAKKYWHKHCLLKRTDAQDERIAQERAGNQQEKKLNNVWTKFVAGLLLLTAVPLASAGPITFQTSGGSVDEYGFSLGVDVSIEVNEDLTDHAFDLDVGETSDKFDFFEVTATGIGGVIGVIEAALDFVKPDKVSATGDFFGVGGIFGVKAFGFVTVLSQPDDVVFGDGGLFAVNFYGFHDGCKDWFEQSCTSLSGVVQADVTLLRAPTAVPEPGTLGLLGAGLLGIGLMRRRFGSR